MSSRAKNHHIAPKVLQKQFSVEGDIQRIWRAKKTKNGAYVIPERKRIEKTFVIRDYNTILENDQRSDCVEREYYGKIDDFLGRLLPKIIPILQNGEIPKFSPDALSSLREFIMHMAKRTPDFHSLKSDIKLGREYYETVLNSLPNNTRLEDVERLKNNLANDARLRDIGRDIRVRATTSCNSPRVAELLSELVPRWVISRIKHSYILSSIIVYRIGNGGSNGLTNPNMEMWMPITPKISLVLLRDARNKIPYMVADSPTWIRVLNEFAVKNSFEVASHSEALLKSLVRR